MVAEKKLNALVVVGLLVVLGAVVAGFLWFRVCDEQLTGDGKIVVVCRHMATTDPPVVVLGVLALVMLSMFYVEISGFGITLKRKVVEIDERTRKTERKATALQETVGDLTDFNRERLVPEAMSEARAPTGVPDARIVHLARHYNTLRWTMPSGDARTRQMTAVTSQLRELLRGATDFDIDGHLRHQDRGVRLAAYAYLQSHATPAMLPALVDAAAGEDKPFGQYSALRAVRHQLAAGATLTGQHQVTLRVMRDRLGATTDRGRFITGILGDG